MKLQWQFNLVMVPLVVIPLLIIGTLGYRYLLESEANQLRAEMTSEINQLATEVNVTLNQAASDLEILATDHVTGYYLLARHEQLESEFFLQQLLTRFENFHQAVEMYDELRIILPDGSEDARWGRSEYQNVSQVDNNIVTLLQSQPEPPERYRTVQYNPDSGQWSLYSYRALQLHHEMADTDAVEADFQGYISSTISLERFRQKFDELASKPGFYIELTNEFGQPRVYYGDERVQSQLRGSEQGELIQVTIHPIEGYQISYSALRSASHAQSMVLSSNIYVVTLVFIIFTILALSFLLRRTVLNPMTELMAASRDLSHGVFGRMPPINTNTEFQHLSQCFNGMIERLQQNQDRIQFVADHDSLTDLPNRRMFQLLLNKVIAHAERNDHKAALLFLDIDNFKLVNDSLGHGVGDQLLMQVAVRINELVRATDSLLNPMNESVDPADVLARLGGDEFTLILPQLTNELNASAVAQRILDSLHQEFTVNEHQVRVTASIGIAVYPDNGASVEELVKSADIAMYHAKNSGKNNYKYFNEQLNELLKFRIQQERELCRALVNKEFELYLQPVVRSEDESLYGFETLIRWNHPTRGLVMPDCFIPLAEECGLIVEIGDWVMFEACRIARDWMDAGHDSFRFSVNVSGVQFERQDVFKLIEDALQKYQVPAKYLVIELTETAIMTKHSEKSGVLQSIRQLGVKVALDDFGSGYSSLSYLRTLPVDYLKIDRQFIVESRDKSEVRSIINAIAIMAHALGLLVVAEGVEKPGETRFLNGIGCDLIQGYYYSKPVPEPEAQKFVQQWRQYHRVLRKLRRRTGHIKDAPDVNSGCPPTDVGLTPNLN